MLQGFPAKVRVAELSVADSDEAEAKRQLEARNSLINLAVAWSLVLLCCTHHMGHVLHSLGYHQFAHGVVMDTLGNPVFSGLLGGFALLGPGRQ